jgi:hypothetical protein
MLPSNNDPNALDEMIYRYMPVFAKKVDNMDDLNKFMDEFENINRAIYFSNEDDPPRYFKGLTSYFKDKLEFAYVTKDAFEVFAYFNQTKKPRWIVLKKNGAVGYTTRRYVGKRTFDNLRDYLKIFAEKKELDRSDTDYKKKIRERGSHIDHKLHYQDFQF